MKFRTDRLNLKGTGSSCGSGEAPDTPCSTLEGYGEGPQRAANGKKTWSFFKDAQGFGRLDAGSRAGFASPRSPPWTSVFLIFLISVRERMLIIRARSSRDG